MIFALRKLNNNSKNKLDQFIMEIQFEYVLFVPGYTKRVVSSLKKSGVFPELEKPEGITILKALPIDEEGEEVLNANQQHLIIEAFSDSYKLKETVTDLDTFLQHTIFLCSTTYENDIANRQLCIFKRSSSEDEVPKAMSLYQSLKNPWDGILLKINTWNEVMIYISFLKHLNFCAYMGHPSIYSIKLLTTNDKKILIIKFDTESG